MSNNCTFIQLLSGEDKGTILSGSVTILQNGKKSSSIFSIDPAKFSMVPGSPFAYWVSDHIRQLFVNLPSFEGEGRTVNRVLPLPMISDLSGHGGK